MLSLKLNSSLEPKVRDTRDEWEIRQDLNEAQKRQIEMLSELSKYDELLTTYQKQEQTSKEKAIQHTLENLKAKAGVSDAEGNGITISISPLFSEELSGKPISNPNPDLLKKLINELNSYEAEKISINDRRIVNTSVIRDINGSTKIDGVSVDTYPLKVKVIGKDADKLYSRVTASDLDDLFAGENLNLQIGKPEKSIKIKSYDDPVNIKYLKPWTNEDNGGTS
jgi:uncharacterized protein YlxW (UPF0749 family)